MTTNNLSQFLQIHRTDKGLNQSPTHTRIAEKGLDIYGGSYFISEEDLEDFYYKYYNQVFINNHLEYLTEKQSGNSIAVDLDFRY